MKEGYLGKRLVAAVRLLRWEDQVAAAAKRALEARRDTVLSSLRVSMTASLPPDPFDLGTWDDALSDELAPALRAVFVEIGDALARQFIGAPGVLQTIDLDSRLDRVIGVMRGLGPDTSAAIGHTLTVGVGLGESIDKLAARVQDVFDSSDMRAERIARTEVVGASNGASHDVATAIATAGYALDKVWLATDDERTRESHADADGQQVAIDQPFEVGDTELMYPGDPDADDPGEVVNCRCTLVYEDAGGSASDDAAAATIGGDEGEGE